MVVTLREALNKLSLVLNIINVTTLHKTGLKWAKTVKKTFFFGRKKDKKKGSRKHIQIRKIKDKYEEKKHLSKLPN